MSWLTRRQLLQAGAAAWTLVSLDALGEPPAATDAAAPQGSPRRSLLDFDWRFHLGHAQDPLKDFGFGLNQETYAKAGARTAAAVGLDYDDSRWRALNLPHDWAVELPLQESVGLDPQLAEDPRAAHGFRPLGREFPETSVGWYRRVFSLSEDDAGRRISIEFDGVFRDCLVFFNGYIVGRNGSGYLPFRVDVTDFANFGGRNVLTVRVDASLGEGWFYEGAGIYRHVWLVRTAPLHVPQWGTWVRSTVDGEQAALAIATEVANEDDAPKACRVISTVLDPEGRAVATLSSDLQVPPWQTVTLQQAATLQHPLLWSLETPRCYRLLSRIEQDGAAVDEYATSFGIRSIRFDPDQGFFLNGQPVKLKGSCNHQDHAGVGVALPDRLHAWRIGRLKEMGSNAYRAAHNPPAPELLEACDRLGMLVVDEARMMSSDPEGLGQLERMLRRDRNHPSIILWSLGNEEPQQGSARGARIARSMKRLVERLDGTRPCTEALDSGWGEGVTPVLDVMGFNYRTHKIAEFHRRFPRLPIIGTETGSTVSSRGVYLRQPGVQQIPAYDRDAPWWASTAESWWQVFDREAYIAGGFVWTGFDYRGEPTPFSKWPSAGSYFGAMDACGFAKDNFYYYRTWWTAQPALHLFPHWNWQGREGEPVEVWCYCNLDSVELLLNGRSLGMQAVVRDGHLSWEVPYQSGVLEARGFKQGRLILTERRETTGPAAAVVLRPDRERLAADGRDLSVIRVEVVDRRGRLVPTAQDPISFDVSGAGALIGLGNGDPTSLEPDKGRQRRAFNGLCQALVQSARTPGRIRIEAAAAGLNSAVALIDCSAPSLALPVVPSG
jgi:beta-galactosidase